MYFVFYVENSQSMIKTHVLVKGLETQLVRLNPYKVNAYVGKPKKQHNALHSQIRHSSAFVPQVNI